MTTTNENELNPSTNTNTTTQQEDQSQNPSPSDHLSKSQIEQSYSYEEPDPDDEEAQQQQIEQQEAIKTASSLKNLPDISQYTEAVKELAQQKAFHVLFLDGKRKVYQRRKASMKEVIELERKRAEMKRNRGTPLQIAQALAHFYWYSSQVHLIETRTGRPMSKTEYENVVFEDFRKIIDACEFVMLFGVPS